MEWILFATTCVEVFLLGIVIFLFYRLRRSEGVLLQLRANQGELLAKLEASTKLEKELVDNFQVRQQELAKLDRQLQFKIKEVKRLLAAVDNIANSPEFIRQLVLVGHKRGESVESLARKTGLSVEEISLILGEA